MSLVLFFPSGRTTSTLMDRPALVAPSAKCVLLNLPTVLVYGAFIHTLEKAWSTQVMLEDELQALPNALRLLLASQPAEAEEGQHEEKPLEVHTLCTHGFCCSCSTELLPLSLITC